MSVDATTPETATSTATAPDWNYLPCVQYGFPDDVGPIRSPKLRTIFEPIPGGSDTVGPVYRVPKERYEQQGRFEEGYEVQGVSSIAKEIQDECEANDRVLYPIHIESDKYRKEGPETLIEWFREFVENYLEVPFHECTLYFSGNRSIHVHVPRFVSSEDDREQLKNEANTFCEDTGAKLDLSLYSPKALFRIPGVTHHDTGLSKVEIEPDWDNARIYRESSQSNISVPDTYADVLMKVFASNESLTETLPQHSVNGLQNPFQILDPDKTVLDFSTEKNTVETPLIEQTEYPERSSDVPEWAMYNSSHFSPYALAEGNPRSVAAVKVKGGAFARKQRRNGATMIPAYFYGAVGCNGEFSKKEKHAPLQLSKKDYRKWDFHPGNTIVIIGGKSGSSRLLDVDPWEATVVGHALTGDEGSRQEALEYLSDRGYDTGVSGSKCSTGSSGRTRSGNPGEIFPARKNPQTPAEKFQRKAEQEGIETLSHIERIRVAFRHLRYGWDPTWEWFQEQYGSDFSPRITWNILRGIVEDDQFDEYDHIEVPDKPS